MRGHNLCFRREIKKIISELSVVPTPILSGALKLCPLFDSGMVLMRCHNISIFMKQ